jgi:hypothetical protein
MNQIKMLAMSLLGRLHQGELDLAKSILRWKIRKEGRAEPADKELEEAAANLLAEAREIARRRGKSLYEILKEEAKGLFRPKDS